MSEFSCANRHHFEHLIGCSLIISLFIIIYIAHYTLISGTFSYCLAISSLHNVMLLALATTFWLLTSFLYIIMMLVLLLIWFNHYMCFVIDITSDCGPCTSNQGPPFRPIMCILLSYPAWLEKLNQKISDELPFNAQIILFYFLFCLPYWLVYRPTLSISRPPFSESKSWYLSYAPSKPTPLLAVFSGL